MNMYQQGDLPTPDPLANNEFWFDVSGVNTLKGIPGDCNDPAVLPDHYIQTFLLLIPAARESFDRLFPLMTLAEQARLTILASQATQGLEIDDVQFADNVQFKWNTAGVRRGGAPFPGIFVNGQG